MNQGSIHLARQLNIISKLCMSLLCMLLLFMPHQSSAAQEGAGNAPKKITMVRFTDYTPVEVTENAVKDGLSASGLQEGRDYTLKMKSAQNDLATLSNLMDAAVADGSDIVVAIHPQSLEAAVSRIKDIPIVFHIVVDPFAYGAGKSDTDHVVNVTGVYISDEWLDKFYNTMMDYIRDLQPDAKTLGTICTTGDANSEANLKSARKAAEKLGMKLESVSIGNPAEMFEGLNVLVSKGIEAYLMIPDQNILGNASTIQSKMDDFKIPVYGLIGQIKMGALLSHFPDLSLLGKTCGRMISEIIKGKKPSEMPLERPDVPSVLGINLKTAQKLGIKVPDEMIKQAGMVIQP